MARYVERCFHQHVLDDEQLQKAVDGAVAGVDAEVRELEARLLVDLRADMDFTADFPGIRVGLRADGQRYDAMFQAVDASAEDFVNMLLVRLPISWVAGDAIGGKLTGANDSFLKKQVINLAANRGVDKVLDIAAAQAGYDPEGALADKVTAALGRMRSLLIEGDPKADKTYWSLCAYRDGYPDETIRKACREAAAAMEPCAIVGLRHRLLGHLSERSRLREEALRKLVFGPGAPPDQAAAAPRIDPQKCVSPEQILQSARRCRAYYGGEQP